VADNAAPDLEMAFGYYMAVPTRADKSSAQFLVYNGSAQTWRLALI